MSLVTERLIECVKRHPLLYDFHHPDYRNSKKRDRIWARIGLELNETVNEVKKKWKNVRDTYLKYLKCRIFKVQSNRRYYNFQWATRMEYFRSYMPVRKSPPHEPERTPKNIFETCYVPSIKPKVEDTSDTEMTEDVTVNSNSTMPSVITSSVEPHNAESTDKQYLKTTGSQQETSSKDAAVVFASNGIINLDATDLVFLGYAKTLKSFSNKRRAETKLKIAEIMIKQELEHLDDVASSH